MLTCPICDNNFETDRAFRNHAKTTLCFVTKLDTERELCNIKYGKQAVDVTIQQYTDGQLCCDDINKSPTKVVKLISLLGIKRTSKEERQTERYKVKYLRAIQQKYGATVTNISQVAEVQQLKEATFAARYGSYREYLEQLQKIRKHGYTSYVGTVSHKATMQKIADTCLERYGHSNFGKGYGAKQKSKQTKRDTIATWDYQERLERTSIARTAVNHRGGGVSKPEMRVRHCLVELGIDFVANKHLWHYNYDMVFGNIIIEVQGDMWHAWPGKYKSTDLIMGKLLAQDLWDKDAKKKRVANENGFRLIAIWEHDINSRTDTELVMFVDEIIKDTLNDT